MITGTWRQLISQGVYLCQWPGWSGYLRLNALPGGSIDCTAFDRQGKSLVGQVDYSRFADRPEWHELNLNTDNSNGSPLL